MTERLVMSWRSAISWRADLNVNTKLEDCSVMQVGVCRRREPVEVTTKSYVLPPPPPTAIYSTSDFLHQTTLSRPHRRRSNKHTNVLLFFYINL